MRYIYMITAALMFISCEFDFELDGMDTEPLIHIEATLHQNCDTDLPYAVQGVRAIADNESIKLKNFSLKAYVNDELTDAYLNKESFDKFSGQLDVKSLEPGDKIRIEAESEGYRSISAETIMPERWAGLDINVNRISSQSIEIKVRFKDNPDTEDYYGLGLSVESFIGDRISSVTSVALRGPSVDGNGYASFGEMRVSYTDPRSRLINICNDHGFNGKEKEMVFIADCLESTETERREYSILAYKLSPEMYRYAVARFDSSPWNNSLGFMGLSPVTFTYTNIQGGLGVLACVNAMTYGPYPVP